MQIKGIEFKEVLLEREEEFVIATGASKSALNFVARIETEDFQGYGSCCPSSVTGETPESIRGDLESLSGKLVGEDPTNIQTLNEKMASSHPESNCARACLDMALWDLVGKASERPLYDVLGGSRDRMMTDMSIGIMDFDKTIETAKRIVSRGFRAIKMKIGLDIDEDIAKLLAVREDVPRDIVLSVDANQGYSYETAVEFVKRTKDLGLAYLEQPVSQNDYASLRKIDELSLVPIMVDESFKTSHEAASILAGRTVRLLNIKLLKCGGITESMVIESICAALNGGTQVGCYSESALSIAAGLHFALGGSTIEFLDLDSHFNFPDDFAKDALGFESGLLVVSGRPGLGVEVDFDSLD
jgi:L-alanine-DL-glutamate epimerase-like enolase superfamily enzyme